MSLLSTYKDKFLSKVFGSFGLTLTATALSFVITILLTRTLGAKDYGIYVYAMSWITLLQIPSGLGMRNLIVREVSKYKAREQWNLANGILRWSNLSIVIASSVILLVTVIVTLTLDVDLKSPQMVVFYLALISLPFSALTALRQGTMQGFNHIVTGQIPEKLIQPLLFGLLVLGAFFQLGNNLNVILVMLLRVVTILICFVIGVVLLRKSIPKKIFKVAPDYSVKSWIASVLPFLLISSTHLINNKTDALMLGSMKGAEAVGLYAIANRGASLIGFMLIAINISLSPIIADLYAKNDLKKLQQTMIKSARLNLMISSIIGGALIIFGHQYLAIFGSEFVEGYRVIIILSIGKLVNSATGSVGILLSMTGHERDTALGISISAISNIILNSLLIPKYGINGASIATASSIIIWNIILIMFVYKRLGIKTTALGI